MKRKIGILGGTFDPPHLAHLIIANEVRVKLRLEKIIFLPNRIPPHKKGSGLSKAKDRVKMIRLAISSNPYFEIDTRELAREGKSYTYDTMLILTKEFPEVDFHFIIGGDMVEYLPNWYHIDKLTSLLQFVGVNRQHYGRHSIYPIKWVDIPEIEVSSSLIRQRIANGEPVDYFVPESVKNYIKEHGCYEQSGYAQ